MANKGTKGNKKRSNETRNGGRRAAISDEQLSHATGGAHHAIRVPEPAFSKIAEKVVDGSVPGLTAVEAKQR